MSRELQALWGYLKFNNIEAFLLPINDCFFCEEVIKPNQYLRYVTGFTGSSAVLIVVYDQKAQFFTDGRYLEQAKVELDEKFYDIHDVKKCSPWDWVNKNDFLEVLSYDPRLHTLKQMQKYKCRLQPLVINPVSKVWLNRPLREDSKIMIYEQAYELSYIKRIKVMNKTKTLPYLIANPESLCWLLNIRANDLTYTPVLLAFGILYPNYICDVFYSGPEPNSIQLEGVNFFAMEDLDACLREIDNISLDLNSTSLHQVEAVKSYIDLVDPCLQFRASNMGGEILLFKKAHLRDGIAMTKFLYWLYHNDFTEFSAEQKLLQLRSEQEHFWGPSFKTIAAYGPNAAFIHYHNNTKEKIEPGNVFLIDSGGQYLDGTTDVTRTLAVGLVEDPEIIRHYTLVLKGHINLAKVVFPQGTNGAQLDVLARQFLWSEHLNYAHGTGHGVGLFLNVHEGAHGTHSAVSLAQGMVISNEPGFYKSGAYGIRIENLLCVVEDSQNFLKFETLTCVPINTDLVNLNCLTNEEIDWLNNYNRWVMDSLKPYLSLEINAWMKQWLI